MPDLYDAVGHGMWAYANAAFRVTILDRERFAPEPGTLVAVTHRRETDVPVICPWLYFAMGGRRNTTGRMHFAARDDMFPPGFFAGFPPELPLRARRLLYRVGVGRWLPLVNVFPIRSAQVARVGEVLAARPARPLEEVLPTDEAAGFAERASACGLARPAQAGTSSAASTPTSSGGRSHPGARTGSTSSGARERPRPRETSARSSRSSATATS